MSARRSALAGEYDARLFAMLGAAAARFAGTAESLDASTRAHYLGNEAVLAEYVREAWRSRWTYRLIGEALGMTAARVSAIHKRDLARRGL